MHVAQAENLRFPYEVLLRSVLKHLVDAASNEFLFIIDFFKTSPKDTFNRYCTHSVLNTAALLCSY